MKYISTRGGTPALSFMDAVMTGLAPDGGLLIPESVPSIADRLDDFKDLSFVNLAKQILPLYIADISGEEISRLVDSAYSSFDCPEIVSLVPVDDVHILELFHGPTLAFKDIALQLLGRVFEYILNDRKGYLNLLAATSGDTGSAAIAGVKGLSNIDVFVMYPKGRISELQELQMITVLEPNVHCLAVEGSFDDCQNIMKNLFSDLDFKEQYHLGAVNSVNWARVLAQIVYYGFASLYEPSNGPKNFVIPTGNFGNIFAGFLAKKMGFPIEKLIISTNENDILARFFNTGEYSRGKVHFTASPAMDIQVPSNFERFLYYSMDGDTERLRAFIGKFMQSGTAIMDDYHSKDILATSIDDRETISTINRIYAENGYIADPHTAVGLAAAEHFKTTGMKICLATAHPAKFPEVVDKAIREKTTTHERLFGLENLKSRTVTIKAEEAVVADYIMKLGHQ